ncbi:hypothetical protein MGA5115_02175 [Marinomonas gallaica]|uniref:Tryptophan synthase subunit beta like protein n=1 Tax=Marinomonas gallaica TaxID=1806667 RepID=A0A1C3JSF3_9GAMM|nr:hypothetical protein [Marinomonas gallaica]SBT18057.1 hypothetical protein MGA5115_02175 [Marinomonas gallaica]SBT19835.1 hypothetical protein MGA5116_00418 [Marinomonas gallaica]
MLYAKLSSQGDILDVAPYQDDEYSVLVAPNDPFVADILAAKISQESSQELLNSSDQEMMRVLEDLIDLLTEKRLIQFTELPMAAQKKLLSRKFVRRIHSGNNDTLIGEIPDDDALI